MSEANFLSLYRERSELFITLSRAKRAFYIPAHSIICKIKPNTHEATITTIIPIKTSIIGSITFDKLFIIIFNSS